MIPQKKTNTFSTNATVKHFSIANNAFAFNSLIEKLYSRPEESTVREIIANAVDATIENGEDFPVEVWLTDNMFRVRDYGTGMTEAFVMENYSRLFDSTKRKTNSVTGMVGLGSKSPFSISDNYIVKCYTETSVTVYNIFLDEQGIPSISKTAEDAGDYTTGVEVIVPFEESRAQAMREAVKVSAICHVDSNIAWHCETGVDDTSVFRVTDNTYVTSCLSSYNHRLFIKQGAALYDVSAHGSSRSYRGRGLRQNFSVIVEVPIGTFSVTPSREDLVLTSEDKDKIFDLETEAYLDVRTKLANIGWHCLETGEFTLKVQEAYACRQDDVKALTRLLFEGNARVVVNGGGMPCQDAVSHLKLNSTRYTTIRGFTLHDIQSKRIRRGVSNFSFENGKVLVLKSEKMPSMYRKKIAQYEEDELVSVAYILVADRENTVNRFKLQMNQEGATVDYVYEEDLPTVKTVRTTSENTVPYKKPDGYHLFIRKGTVYRNGWHTFDEPSSDSYYISSTVSTYETGKFSQDKPTASSTCQNLIVSKFLPADIDVYRYSRSSINGTTVGKPLCDLVKARYIERAKGLKDVRISKVLEAVREEIDAYGYIHVPKVEREIDKKEGFALDTIKAVMASHSFPKDAYEAAEAMLCMEETEEEKVFIEAVKATVRWYMDNLYFAFSPRKAEHIYKSGQYLKYVLSASLPKKHRKTAKMLNLLFTKDK